jgi:hypothetical protein
VIQLELASINRKVKGERIFGGKAASLQLWITGENYITTNTGQA